MESAGESMQTRRVLRFPQSWLGFGAAGYRPYWRFLALVLSLGFVLAGPIGALAEAATAPQIQVPGGGGALATDEQSAKAGASELVWKPYEAKALGLAMAAKEPAVLTFGAEWCAPCKEMKARTFVDPAVLEAAVGTHLFYVDMTDGDGYTEQAQRSFKVRGAPITIFFGANGAEYTRRAGFIPPPVFERLLRESAKRPEND